MGFECEDCCRSCCYSTPFLTLGVVGFTGVALTGFTLSSIYGLATMDTVEHIENGTVFMAPVVCGAVLLTFLPLVLLSVLSYCVTGYIRDVLFHRVVKTCIGSILWNLLALATAIFFVFLWLVVCVGLGGVMVYFIQARIFCDQRDTNSSSSSGGFPYVDTDFNYVLITGEEDLDSLCSDGLEAGVAFAVALLFAAGVLMGLVVLAVVGSANYISARDHIDYRQNTRTDYDMKRVQ